MRLRATTKIICFATCSRCYAFINISARCRPQTCSRRLVHAHDAKDTRHSHTERASNAQYVYKLTLDPNIASQFKVVACSSKACSQKRKVLQLGEFATYSALYERIQAAAPMVTIEECPCLGACQQAPCVAIEHDDYIGPVALEGMHQAEFAGRVFHRIVNDEDADRVWMLLEQAIITMAKQDNHDAI